MVFSRSIFWLSLVAGTGIHLIIRATEYAQFENDEIRTTPPGLQSMVAEMKERSSKQKATAVAVSQMNTDNNSRSRLGTPTNSQTATVSGPPSSLYWDLNCPFEMSLYSGAHMKGEYLKRAEQARDLSLKERTRERVQSALLGKKMKKESRVVLVGDSLMRQVFISIGCMTSSAAVYAVPWFQNHFSPVYHPNTIEMGEHSKFLEGAMRLPNDDDNNNNAVEVFYHPGAGNLLSLSDKTYNMLHETDDWIEACEENQDFYTSVVRIPEGYTPAVDGPMGDDIVTHKRIKLTKKDVVIINASVHRDRAKNLPTLTRLLDCMKERRAKSDYVDDNWPSFAYMMTTVSHFPGAGDTECLPAVNDRYLQSEDYELFQKRTKVLGQGTLIRQMRSGNLHVGNGDCMHWLQPGMPDLLAATVAEHVASVSP